jgi:peptide/nickel transport system permease protein
LAGGKAGVVATYLVRRVLWALMLFLAVTVVTYVIFFTIPANPAQLISGRGATSEQIAQAEKFLGLDKPIYIQYLRFLERLSPVAVSDGLELKTPSLGRSFVNRQDVNETVLRAAPVTASVVFGGIVFVLLVSIPVGVLSALRPRSVLDRAAMMYVLVGISLPSFWIGLILAYVVSFKLGWTPITGYCDVFNASEASSCGGAVDWAHHMILPWATLALVQCGTYVRFIRADVMETLGQDYVRTARAKGAAEPRVLRSHILRNAMLPVVTILGMDIGLLLGGSIFIETVFGLPGLGFEAVNSISQFDLPVTQGVVVFGAVAIIVFNLFVDLLYAWIDPRIRVT